MFFASQCCVVSRAAQSTSIRDFTTEAPDQTLADLAASGVWPPGLPFNGAALLNPRGVTFEVAQGAA